MAAVYPAMDAKYFNCFTNIKKRKKIPVNKLTRKLKAHEFSKVNGCEINPFTVGMTFKIEVKYKKEMTVDSAANMTKFIQPNTIKSLIIR